LGDYTSIADVGGSLMSVIRAEMLADPSLAPKFTGADSITLDPPTDGGSGQGTAALSVYLYRILEDPYLKNQTMGQGRGGALRRAPLTLDLFYLITPLLTDPRDQHIVLGKVMQILYDRPTLEGADLTGGLAGSDEQVRAVFNPVSLEESARVWQALETAYRLSICYTLRVALVNSNFEAGMQRVVSRQTTIGVV
jgi:hypothetical protein